MMIFCCLGVSAVFGVEAKRMAFSDPVTERTCESFRSQKRLLWLEECLVDAGLGESLLCVS